ncbi:MAG: ImmA/IrrE family metallo-endopeptidase [Pseudomonadota bacterium]
MIQQTAIRDPHQVALRFQPLQLRRARELSGFNKADLGLLISSTPALIGRLERGVLKPNAEIIARLALALKVPMAFFARTPLTQPIDPEDCHFRSLRATHRKLRRQALRYAEIVQELTTLLSNLGVEMPGESFNEIRTGISNSESIEKLAMEVRRSWGLGNGPIPQLIPLLESQGAQILPLAWNHRAVDSFSCWHDEKPFIMPVLHKPNSHVHFDLAHELGHLVMHEDVGPADLTMDNEANHFAAAFLLPRDSFIGEAPRRWSLSTFLKLQARWRTPVQVLVHRAHSLGCLPSSSYQRASADLNRRASKLRDDDWDLQGPQVLKKALALVEDDWRLPRLADALTLHPANLSALLDTFLEQSAVGKLAESADAA